MNTKFILEYRYENAEDFRFEAEYENATDAHFALLEHIEKWKHIEVRVRKVVFVTEERVVGKYVPIIAEDY